MLGKCQVILKMHIIQFYLQSQSVLDQSSKFLCIITKPINGLIKDVDTLILIQLSG